MFKTIKLVAVIIALAGLVAAQTVAENKPTEDKEKLQKEAVAFLRETLTDVNGMRSLENRISFAAEIASLMWFHDEREARAMYNGVITDFRDLLMRYDSQINALGITAEDQPSRGGFMAFGAEQTDKSRVLRRLMTAMGVRQQIAMSIAEHDAELAYSFYYDSLTAISNPEIRKKAENNESYFEAQLLAQIAETNPSKAAQYGSRSLVKGVSHQHLELLKKIHAKDADKGAEFGAAILSRLKTDKIDNHEFYLLDNLIEFGGQTLDASRKPGGKRAVYALSELRDLAELLAQAMLARGDSDSIGYGYIDTIQKYAPARAAQLRAKFKRNMANAANAMTNAAYNGAGFASGYGSSNSASNSYGNVGDYERAQREAEERDKAERKMLADVQSLTTKELPKEERDKIVAQARKILMQTTGRDKKIMGLSMLAAQVAKMGDKELANELMRDAERLVNPAPKNYQDFMLTWILASGYASADSDKAFVLLEDTIGRANETLAAFVKVGEFIDVAEEMIQDGEVQVGAFGGQMVRGLTRELGLADATIQVLAKADFTKTKNLTNGFQRTEIRVLAKMMVLRAVLNPKQILKPEDVTEGLELNSEPEEN